MKRVKPMNKQYFIAIFAMSLILSSCSAPQEHLAKPISIPPKNVTQKIMDGIEKLERKADSNSEKIAKENDVETSKTADVIDMTGDYIGDIPCPNPPIANPYTVYNKDNPFECIVLYVENIDDANIKFHLTKAVQDSSNGEYTEALIFKEHIAHYNGSAYEYIGVNYHLYFQFSVTEHEQVVASDHKMSVYGLGSLFEQNNYGDIIEYNGISGVQFSLNVPFAG